MNPKKVQIDHVSTKDPHSPYYTFYGLQEIELQERVLKFWEK